MSGVVITLGFLARSRGTTQYHTKAPVPWFVLCFIVLVGINSVIPVPSALKPAIVNVTTFLLSMALAAMGLETDIRKLRAKGLRPLLLGLCSFLFIATFSLALVKMMA